MHVLFESHGIMFEMLRHFMIDLIPLGWLDWVLMGYLLQLCLSAVSKA